VFHALFVYTIYTNISLSIKFQAEACFTPGLWVYADKKVCYDSIVLLGNIDQTLMNSLHSLLNLDIGVLDCLVITTVYILCPLNTHVTPILWCIGLCNSYHSFRPLFIYNNLGEKNKNKNQHTWKTNAPWRSITCQYIKVTTYQITRI